MTEKDGGRDQLAVWETTYANSKDFFGAEPSPLGVVALGLFQKEGAKDVLELGCGQGRDTWLFVKNGLKVIAMDYSRSGICQMREVAKQEDMPGSIRLLVHDAREGLPLPNNSVDAIYSHMFLTMELWEYEIAHILQECWRVLKPGGLNVYSVRNDHDPHYGKFRYLGEDMWQNPMGYVVQFFTEKKVKRLAEGYHLELIEELVEDTPPFPKRLYQVVLRKPH